MMPCFGGQNRVAFGNDTSSANMPPAISRWRRAFSIADGELDARSLRWRSDLQGELGTGGKLLVRELWRGVHTVTLSLAAGGAAERQVWVTVNPR